MPLPHPAVLLLLATARLTEPAPPPELPDGLDVAPWDHLYLEGCSEALAEAGVKRFNFVNRRRVKTLKAPRRQKPEWPYEVGPMYCHVPQALHYIEGPEGITYSGYVLVNCRMALALAELERIVQEEALRIFGPRRPVTKIKQYGAYNCRRIKAYPWVQSEHSFGNAIDIGGFQVRGLGRVDVKKHWRARWPAQQPKADFLHAVARRLERSRVFPVVLTPGNDERHRSHFHLDLGR